MFSPSCGRQTTTGGKCRMDFDHAGPCWEGDTPAQPMTGQRDREGDEYMRRHVECPKCGGKAWWLCSMPRHRLPADPPATPPARCHAQQDGDCDWPECPQERDGEPQATGRHCPLDVPCSRCGLPEGRGGCDCEPATPPARPIDKRSPADFGCQHSAQDWYLTPAGCYCRECDGPPCPEPDCCGEPATPPGEAARGIPGLPLIPVNVPPPKGVKPPREPHRCNNHNADGWRCKLTQGHADSTQMRMPRHCEFEPPPAQADHGAGEVVASREPRSDGRVWREHTIIYGVRVKCGICGDVREKPHKRPESWVAGHWCLPDPAPAAAPASEGATDERCNNHTADGRRCLLSRGHYTGLTGCPICSFDPPAPPPADRPSKCPLCGCYRDKAGCPNGQCADYVPCVPPPADGQGAKVPRYTFNRRSGLVDRDVEGVWVLYDDHARATAAEGERDAARGAIAMFTDEVAELSERLTTAEQARDAAHALLREVGHSGVELNDPRMSYLVVQIDRETWSDVQALATGTATTDGAAADDAKGETT